LQAVDAEGQTLSQHPFLWAAEAAHYIEVNVDVNTDVDANPRAQALDTPIGRCLGSVGINAVMKRVQNAIVAKGYITTRVLAGPQDLTTGELILTVIPGRIREVRFSVPSGDDSTADESSPSISTSISPPTALWNALPRRYDQRLFLRDIEQGLENLKRVPTAEADIQIVPSTASDARPGDSDLVVDWQQGRPLRFNVSLDNAGSESTGKYQGAFTFSYDNPLALNDLFYLSVNNDLGGGLSGPRGTRGNTLYYSIPFGYSLLSLTASDNSYHQTIVGATQNFVYSGESDNIDLTVSRHI
jgi:hemolysin activation/secretion protein